MQMEKGSLSIESENMFPIIKKWLYSDHDIFVRELVSNGCDAITKLKKLEVMGEYDFPEDYKASIQVEVSPEHKTLSFTDTGIGMTEAEVKEYINQVAFSGATDFLEKYKDKTNEDQIIGHFGLGFYSAFMVADKVTIDTLSWQKDAVPVHWESEGGINFEMSDGDKKEVGTKITLYLSEDSVEFANEYRIKEIIEKYCSFMPVNIYLSKVGAEQEYETIDAADIREDDVVVEKFTEEAKTEEKENENGEKETVEISPAKEKAKINKRPVSLSDTTPLWMKHPNECTDEEYKSFYRKVFNDYKEPLFWIHLNMDCPDLPLNVSRSALQNDGFVKKISDYITKKVADKLSGMYKVDRENYEKYWDDISPFIKFGCLKDQKFQEKMKDFIIFKNLDDKFITLPEYVENVKGNDEEQPEVVDAEDVAKEEAGEETETKEEEPTTVYYVTDVQQQSQYINLFREQGMDALILAHTIDQPFITQLEQSEDVKVHFQRIDSDISDSMKEEGDEETLKKQTETLSDVFKKALGKDQLEVQVQNLKNENISSMITLSEETRRMQDMMKMYSAGGMGMDMSMFGGGETLILNANNALVKYILEHTEGEHVDMFCKQLYDLAMLANKPLPAEEMTDFVARSNEIMLLLTQE